MGDGHETTKPGIDNDGYIQEWRTIKVSDPHDGLIGLTASSPYDTSLDQENKYWTDIPGVNHMEMGSHQAMLYAIIEAYNISLENFNNYTTIDTSILIH